MKSTLPKRPKHSCNGVHPWLMPNVGDDCVSCSDCNAHVDFFRHLDWVRRDNILHEVAVHASPAHAKLFAEKLDAAMADFRRRCGLTPYPPPDGSLDRWPGPQSSMAFEENAETHPGLSPKVLAKDTRRGVSKTGRGHG